MLENENTSTVFEGSRDEVASQIESLPDCRYRVEVVPIKSELTPAQESLRRLLSRTPEEVEADDERILAKSRKAAPLPPGKTLEDMVAGTWPGDETDEQIIKLLKEMS